MPRENRKRGKKHKKVAEETYAVPVQYEEPVEEAQGGPSWIVSAPGVSEFNEEAPFGYVDSEVKAYFRTVDVQIREWQEQPHPIAEFDETDPNEGMFNTGSNKCPVIDLKILQTVVCSL